MLLEEYRPKVCHIAGELNLLADALSRLDFLEHAFDVLSTDSDSKPLVYEEKNMLLVNTKLELLMPLASERTMKDDRFPLEPKVIAEYQMKSDSLVKEHKLSASEVKDLSEKELDKVQIVHFRGRLLIPMALKDRVLDWYHIIMCHPGVTVLYQTLKQNVYWKGIKSDVEAYCKTCHQC